MLKGCSNMILFIKNGAPEQRVNELEDWISSLGLSCRETEISGARVLCLTGNVWRLDEELLGALDIVASVQRVSEPYKAVSRSFHPQDSVINVGGPLLCRKRGSDMRDCRGGTLGGGKAFARRRVQAPHLSL